MLRYTARLIVLLLALLVLGGCTDLPTEPAETADMRVRGITLADWTADGYGTIDAAAAIDNIGLVGANTVTFLVTAYQQSTAANTVIASDPRTPTALAMSNAVSKAKSVGVVGILVSLKLHVDVNDGEWRGHIRPENPSAWFASYSDFVMSWANFASNLGVDQLVVGTELAGLVEHEGQWRTLIARVRSVYDGELVYAASWDEAPLVPFWDALDCVGINFYAPVMERAQTGRFEVLSGWQPWLERIRVIHKQANRDILITEIGYRSVDGAGMHPYDFARDGAVDNQEQADLYWGALQALGDKPWIRGVYWWNWLIRPSPQQDLKDYTPEGKPAEEELRNAWML